MHPELPPVVNDLPVFIRVLLQEPSYYVVPLEVARHDWLIHIHQGMYNLLEPGLKIAPSDRHKLVILAHLVAATAGSGWLLYQPKVRPCFD